MSRAAPRAGQPGALLVLLLLALAAGACDSPNYPTNAGLAARVDAPASVRAGESVAIGVTLENPTGTTITVWPAMPRDQAFSVAVTQMGRVLWRSSTGLWMGSGGRPFELGPGRSVTETKTWDLETSDGDPVPPGRYTLEATIYLTFSGGVQATREIEITAR